MEHVFIMVFSEESKNKLIEQGFKYICDNANPHFYIFENNTDLEIDLPKSDYVGTNILSFDGI